MSLSQVRKVSYLLLKFISNYGIMRIGIGIELQLVRVALPKPPTREGKEMEPVHVTELVTHPGIGEQ